MQYVQPYMEQIRQICSTNGVKTLFAFGSVTRNELKADSDIDLVVELEDTDPLSYSDHYFNLKFALQDLLQRPIDLLEQKAIKNPYLKEQIEKTRVLVYGK